MRANARYDYNYALKEYDFYVLQEEHQIAPSYKSKAVEVRQQIRSYCANPTLTSKAGFAATKKGISRPDLKDDFVQVIKQVDLLKGQTVDILDENALKIKGLQNFKGNKLNGVGKLVNRIAIGYDKHLDIGQEGNLNFDKDMDTIIRNSQIVVLQRNREICRLPLSVFDHRGVAVNDDDRFYKLDKPFVIYGDIPFEIIIDCADIGDLPNNGATPPVNYKTYFEFRFGGLFT